MSEISLYEPFDVAVVSSFGSQENLRPSGDVIKTSGQVVMHALDPYSPGGWALHSPGRCGGWHTPCTSPGWYQVCPNAVSAISGGTETGRTSDQVVMS